MIGISSGKGFLHGFERFSFSSKNAVGASRVVESVGIVGAKRDRSLQVPDTFVTILAGIRQIDSQQDSGAHIFRNQLQLLP